MICIEKEIEMARNQAVSTYVFISQSVWIKRETFKKKKKNFGAASVGGVVK